MTFKLISWQKYLHLATSSSKGSDCHPASSDGIVSNGAEGALIDATYTGDPDGDRVDNNDALLAGEHGNDDIIDAQCGDDEIYAGAGNDEVYAGGGNDYVEGGDGDDVIYGDATYGAVQGTREAFRWSEADGFSDGGDVDSFSQSTGSVEVSFTIEGETSRTNSTFMTDAQYVEGVGSDDDMAAPDSAFHSHITRADNSGDYAFEFSDEVANVTFRINDIDGDGVVRITAFDANGAPVEVDLSAGKDLTLDDTDWVPGNDTADSNGGYAANDSEDYSVLVTIAGPVSKICIHHEQDGHADSGISLTDMYFDAIEGNACEPGDDTLLGGEGDDLIYGEDGDDLIDGGAGADTMYGGDDRDTFINVTIRDLIDGNEGGDDWDTLDLRGAAPVGGSLKVIRSEDNAENGEVEFYDANGQSTGTLEFYNIEEVVPCFTPGTLIATPKGEMRVELLEEGDRVITRDNGIQEIRWVGKKTLDWSALNADEHLKPILIEAGSLGNGLPERDMMVSPNHRMLVANDQTALYFDEREVLASAKHLVNGKGIRAVDVEEVTYVHFLFDHHEVVLSDGTWSESFQPGEQSLQGVGNAQRQELFDLFPELETREGLNIFGAARRTLKKYEARMLRL